jgi:hypothetical protein
MNNYKNEIEKLAIQASKSSDSADALRFSQAALNLANAANTQVCMMDNEKRLKSN